MGMIKFNDRFYEFPYRLNTGGLQNGIYVISIVYKDKTYSSRVVIDNAY